MTPENTLIFQLLTNATSGDFRSTGTTLATQVDFLRNTISGMHEFTIKHAEFARVIARTPEKWPRRASELVAIRSGQTSRITEVPSQ
jgi:hypothetical protein